MNIFSVNSGTIYLSQTCSKVEKTRQFIDRKQRKAKVFPKKTSYMITLMFVKNVSDDLKKLLLGNTMKKSYTIAITYKS